MTTVTGSCLPTCTPWGGHMPGCPSLASTACAVLPGATLFTELPFAAGKPFAAGFVPSTPSALVCPCCAAKLALVAIAPGTYTPGGLSLQQMSPQNTAG